MAAPLKYLQFFIQPQLALAQRKKLQIFPFVTLMEKDGCWYWEKAQICERSSQTLLMYAPNDLRKQIEIADGDTLFYCPPYSIQ